MTGLKVKGLKMPQAAGIISGIQRMVLYETRAVSPKLRVAAVGMSCSHVYFKISIDAETFLFLVFLYTQPT